MLIKALCSITTTHKNGNRNIYRTGDVFSVSSEEGEELLKTDSAVGVKKIFNISINSETGAKK